MNDHNNVDKQIDYVMGVLFGEINRNPRTTNYIFDEDDEAIRTAHSQILGIIKTETLKAQIYEMELVTNLMVESGGSVTPRNAGAKLRKALQDHLAELKTELQNE